MTTSSDLLPLRVIECGRVEYQRGLTLQRQHHAAVLAARASAAPEIGRLLLVEHDPVVTVTRRPGAAEHVLLAPELLAARGIAVAQTDRGGDVTFHGPGQIVAYPIVDLNAIGLRLHEYMRTLEEAVIATLRGFGIETGREASATGVWTKATGERDAAKICAMGVRVQRWITLHGLALNVTTNLDDFAVIVPCGLAGRPVTSMASELGAHCPPIDAVRTALASELVAALSPKAQG
ncbi:MAG: lipoyl(octanoyl) transferase LipB [Phycisphaeraceae bacterium]|nr:lipoyl(octanoyl) transferase LipB [Phycisphaeraceae bacterium]MCW5762401.1 lipoyl(octanoyl) transferase LipB [Phycisphaeraceae bacterium]